MGLRAKRITAWVVIAFGAVAILVIIIRSNILYPEQSIVPTIGIGVNTAFATTSPEHYPDRIQIGALHIDARIQSLGLIAGNRMQAPTNYTDVGWYKYGSVPGTRGTAVMYGHVNNGLGLSGVFKDLAELTVGDPISIVTKSGEKLVFKVTEMQIYPYKEVPAQVLGEGAPQTTSKISFITCTGHGLYDPTMGFTYDHRLVVIAEYVGTR